MEMGSGEEAQQAIEALNESDCQGRKLVVNEASPKKNLSAHGINSGPPSRDSHYPFKSLTESGVTSKRTQTQFSPARFFAIEPKYFNVEKG